MTAWMSVAALAAALGTPPAAGPKADGGAEWPAALKQIMDETESPDTFLLTLMLVAEMNHPPGEAGEWVLAALRNADRLQLTDGLFDAAESPRAQTLMQSMRRLAAGTYPTPAANVPYYPTVSVPPMPSVPGVPVTGYGYYEPETLPPAAVLEYPNGR